MASITAMLSTLAVAAVIGWSVQHRPIELMHVTGSGPRVLVVGCIHGTECDPDGYDAHHRQNADGVDLNRSFPTGREPETRVAVASISRLHPAVTIWFHQAENRVRAWGMSEAVARRYARPSGMRYASVRWPSGAATRWQNTALGERSFVVELPAEPLDPWQIAAQVSACLRVALAAP